MIKVRVMCIETCLDDQELPWHLFYFYISSAFKW